jgi:hypothetical protein
MITRISLQQLHREDMTLNKCRDVLLLVSPIALSDTRKNLLTLTRKHFITTPTINRSRVITSHHPISRHSVRLQIFFEHRNSLNCKNRVDSSGIRFVTKHSDDPDNLLQQHNKLSDSIFYDDFDRLTDNGKVFEVDLSSNNNVDRKKLTEVEKLERNKYNTTIQKLLSMYKNAINPICYTKEQVLQQRIVGSCLRDSMMSSRAAVNETKAARLYPPVIHAWTDFQVEVEKFT